jgi:hypothetical protein
VHLLEWHRFNRKGWHGQTEIATTEPAHTVKHIWNSHKPTLDQKLQKSLSVFHGFFADKKNKIRLVQKLKMKEF